MRMSTRFFAVIAAVLLAVVALAAVAVVMLPDRGLVATQPSAVGGPFQLTSHNGRTVTDADFRGKPFLVFFGFTHCPDVCPTTLFEISETLSRLGSESDALAALFITVDPERDTPKVLEQYISNFHPSIVGLTGTPEQIEEVVKVYRAYAKKVPLDGDDYTMDHSAVIYLMDRNGAFVAPFNLKRTVDEAAADLRRYL